MSFYLTFEKYHLKKYTGRFFLQETMVVSVSLQDILKQRNSYSQLIESTVTTAKILLASTGNLTNFLLRMNGCIFTAHVMWVKSVSSLDQETPISCHHIYSYPH